MRASDIVKWILLMVFLLPGMAMAMPSISSVNITVTTNDLGVGNYTDIQCAWAANETVYNISTGLVHGTDFLELVDEQQ